MFTHSANHRTYGALIQQVLLQMLLVSKHFSAFWDANEACVVHLLKMLDIVFVPDRLVAFRAFELQNAEDIQKRFLHLYGSKSVSAIRTSFTFVQPVFYTAGTH